jgi:serine/threonine protein kinase
MLLSNATELSEKVDVYAFGALVFEFLSSRKLYEEELHRLKSVKEPLGSKIIGLVTHPELPILPKKIENSKDSTIIGLKNVMRQALQYNPDDRPTIQEIANQLKGLYESPQQQKIVQNSIRLKLSYFWSKFDKSKQ